MVKLYCYFSKIRGFKTVHVFLPETQNVLKKLYNKSKHVLLFFKAVVLAGRIT